MGMISIDWNWQCAFLTNSNLTGDDLCAIAAVWHAVLRARGMLGRGYVFYDSDDLIRHMQALIEHPWLACAWKTKSKQERRQERAREPPITTSGVYTYRSDGAARGQGSNDLVQSACGSVLMLNDGVVGLMAMRLPTCSNNIAEYYGLLASLKDASIRFPANSNARIEFQVDSMLVARQCRFEWQCLSEELRPLYEDAIHIIKALEQRHAECSIRHIYREFNATADGLANGAINNNQDSSYNWFY